MTFDTILLDTQTYEDMTGGQILWVDERREKIARRVNIPPD